MIESWNQDLSLDILGGQTLGATTPSWHMERFELLDIASGNYHGVLHCINILFHMDEHKQYINDIINYDAMLRCIVWYDIAIYCIEYCIRLHKMISD